ncbi:hypothetical protein CDCA_CDCA08G2512 [Cyanidium caldarium]|uniref:Uncharacterized protein n=1 Tax=Cyanidium caldarium TaxID=2771 RepID=A0AAV9IVY2_CYACA|nr:hypothetical protein CDCA_CDCA08G2512 [Cyanidium caldarium]
MTVENVNDSESTFGGSFASVEAVERQPSGYEKDTQLRRERNRALLRSLGLTDHRAALAQGCKTKVATKQPRKRKPPVSTTDAERPRRALRSAGPLHTDAESDSSHFGIASDASLLDKSASLGRYAFWQIVPDPEPRPTLPPPSADADNVLQTPDKRASHGARRSPLRADHSGTKPPPSRRRRRLTEHERQERRAAMEARFCADLPREPAPYALRTSSDTGADRIPVAATVVPPFTLWSIGVTVHALGELVCLPDDPVTERKWFSSKLAMFAHPFPCGYHASKEHWHRRWHMHIRRDTARGGGPTFTVRSEDGCECYTRHTPSHAWMDACLASHAPGTRISGPLFYGFSDPWLQRVIQRQLAQRAATASGLGDGVESLTLGSYRQR